MTQREKQRQAKIGRLAGRMNKLRSRIEELEEEHDDAKETQENARWQIENAILSLKDSALGGYGVSSSDEADLEDAAMEMESSMDDMRRIKKELDKLTKTYEKVSFQMNRFK